MIEYSLDRTASRGQHTYSCEQNARILMRLERERQLKKVMAASTGKLVISHSYSIRVVCGRFDSQDATMC